MCQSKENGGRRCTGHGKGSSFYPDEPLKNVCDGSILKTSGFSPKLSSALKTLSNLGYEPTITGADASNLLADYSANGIIQNVTTLYVEDSPENIVEGLENQGVKAHVTGSQVVSETPDGIVRIETEKQDETFSVSHLSYNPATGKLDDPYNAVEDAKNQVIRNVKPLKDDPASVLHASVLAGRTGYVLASETALEAEAIVDEYQNIPKEVVWKNWQGLALSKTPSKALQAIHQSGWEKNFPELHAIRDVPQSPYWHPEGSVEVHTQQAADVAARQAEEDNLNDDDRTVVVLGAISHDLGKAVSTDIDEDGKISSHMHHKTGVPLAKKFLKGIGANESVRRQIPVIVYTHMHHAHDLTEKLVGKLMHKLDNDGKGTTIENWTRVAEADKGGRGTASTYGLRKEWLAVAETVRLKAAAPKKLLVNGHFLKENGFEQGPHFGDIIKNAKAATDNGEIIDDQSAREWLKKNYPLGK